MGEMELKNWGAMETLVKYDLVISFKFEEEVKYSLSKSGKEMADELAMERML